MDCYCSSKQLYSQEKHDSISINGQTLSAQRKIINKQLTNEHIAETILENSSIYLPTHILKIDYYQIIDNPLWFYKEFMSSNKPCIIEGAIQDLNIVQDWKNPQDLASQFKSLSIPEFSTSVTPDGFADSIKNKYFIEPEEIKTNIDSIIKWGEKEASQIKQEWIPYVQHQNSNLTQQLYPLYQRINHESRNVFSQAFFNSAPPDAQNFWMGFKNSVSSMHKDPYQNFYPVIVGEKHFTLMPPISILYLQEDKFTNSKWQLIENKLELSVNQGIETNWISCNPDLKDDWERFPHMKKLQEYHFHVNVQAGDMLYLPALWYHQVAQYHNKQPYVIAMNYWFDMKFSHNFALYEAARKVRNYF